MALLRKRWEGLMGVWAFGSRVGGQAREESDWDLAILLEGRADPLALWVVAGQLADILGAPVDLVDLRSASTVLQYLIVTTGERWSRCGARVDLYEAVILSEKTALDEARAPLFQNTLREGRVYDRSCGGKHGRYHREVCAPRARGIGLTPLFILPTIGPQAPPPRRMPPEGAHHHPALRPKGFPGHRSNEVLSSNRFSNALATAWPRR